MEFETPEEVGLMDGSVVTEWVAVGIQGSTRIEWTRFEWASVDGA